jgi:hypothetical protein
VHGNLTVVTAKLAQLQAVGGVLGIFIGRVVAIVALGAFQRKKGTVSLRHYFFLKRLKLH